MQRWIAIMACAALTACGGSDGDDKPGNAAACAPGMIALAGELDGQAVSLEIAWSMRNWNQLSTPKTLDVAYESGSLHLEWSELVAEGDTTPATGTIVMPAGAPHASDAICAGAGTLVGDGGTRFDFSLHGLSLGPTCPGSALSGSIDGCAADKP